MSVTRVVVADDDESMRHALVEVLDAHDGFHVVAQLDIGTDLPATVTRTSADVVVLDVRMPDGGVVAARLLAELSPAPVVIAVSATSDVPTVSAMLQAGASGYLVKGQLGRTFTDDVARCARGQVVIAVPHALQVVRQLSELVPSC